MHRYAILLLAFCPAFVTAQMKPAVKVDPSAEIFKATAPLRTFKITVDAANLKMLKGEPKKYVRCTVAVGDKAYQEVAIRLKGAAGSFRNWDDKPALTLNFDTFVKDQTYCGLDKLHWDGYVRNRNNYRVYFNPKDGKAVFIPHGMDQMFANPTEAIWPGAGALVSRAILENDVGKKKVIAAYKELSEKHFTPEFLKRLDEWIAHIRDELAKTNKDWAKSFENEAKQGKDRMKQRMEHVKKELPKLK